MDPHARCHLCTCLPCSLRLLLGWTRPLGPAGRGRGPSRRGGKGRRALEVGGRAGERGGGQQPCLAPGVSWQAAPRALFLDTPRAEVLAPLGGLWARRAGDAQCILVGGAGSPVRTGGRCQCRELSRAWGRSKPWGHAGSPGQIRALCPAQPSPAVPGQPCCCRGCCGRWRCALPGDKGGRCPALETALWFPRHRVPAGLGREGAAG